MLDPSKAVISKKAYKDLIFARSLFAIFLCFGCVIYSNSEGLPFYSQPFISLYNLSGIILVFSVIYLFLLTPAANSLWYIYCQLIIDVFFVSAVVFVTGSFDSLFTFLYLLVIIYSSMFVLLKGSLLVAAAASLQYTVLISLEYMGVISPYLSSHSIVHTADVSQVIYKLIVISGACFAIAALSGILALQAKEARQELKITRQHLLRVEKMNAMDEMLSGIAHEIKNPLASLSGSIQLLKEDCCPGSSQEKLMRIILRETNRLKEILNDIRLFSRPNKSNASHIRLDTLLRETVELFANDPEWSDRIELFVKIQKQVVVDMDPVHFKQIIWNLLKNAAQSIVETGRIYIELKLAKQDRVHLSIRDTGRGIKKEDAAHIFDPFFTTKPEGSGLGLSIIHKIVDTYDGMIDFETEPGKGTVFTIILKTVSDSAD